MPHADASCLVLDFAVAGPVDCACWDRACRAFRHAARRAVLRCARLAAYRPVAALEAPPGALATGLDAAHTSCPTSSVAADDPRRPLLDLIAERIAAAILRGGGGADGTTE